MASEWENQGPPAPLDLPDKCHPKDFVVALLQAHRETCDAESVSSYPSESRGDSNWKALSQAQNDARGFSPNRGFYNANESKAAIVIQRAARGDFALSKAALDSLIAAETKADKVGQSFVVLKERGDRGVVAFLGARDVKANLDAVPAFEGDFGPFWWIDVTFKPPGGSLPDNEIPF